MTNGRSGAVEKKMHPSPLKNWHPFPLKNFNNLKTVNPTPLLKNHTDMPTSAPPKKKNSSQKDNLG